MPTDSGRRSLMDAILAGEKPKNFLIAKPQCDWIGDGVESMLDGKVYTSKKSYLEHLDRKGYHISGDSLDSRQEKRRKATEKNKEEYEAAKKEAEKYNAAAKWESTP